VDGRRSLPAPQREVDEAVRRLRETRGRGKAILIADP
jgi:hypothetical protein